MNCPICHGSMKRVKDEIAEDKVAFSAYRCEKCGEELLTMSQLKGLAEKYRELRRAKHTRIVRWGNSLAVRIPQELAEELGIGEGDNAVLKKSRSGFEVTTG